MRASKGEMEEKISGLVAEFLHEQLGEEPSMVKTFLYANMVAVHAKNCFLSAEQNLAQIERYRSLLRELKTKEFEMVKPVLKQLLEEITGCEVKEIHSIVGQYGLRFGLFTLSENLENKLTETQEVMS